MNINSMLNIDFYKATHPGQFPKGTTKIVSYLTPRMSRLLDQDSLIMFVLQAYIKENLIKGFNANFFGRGNAVGEYKRILDATLGSTAYDISKIQDLHNLGYLPLQISAIPEGTKVPVPVDRRLLPPSAESDDKLKVPMIEITNTHPDFAWLVNTIESQMSAELWHPMVSANVGYKYRQIVNEYYEISVDDNFPRARALGDFSFRGQESTESAIKSSAAFCLSFLNSATVPTVVWLEDNYNCDCTKEPVLFGSISTEHSVMCLNFAVDGDEETFVKRMLSGKYHDLNFSMVSDSYDYWNMVDVKLPAMKELILAHNGCLLVRGDSGNPVDIVTNTVFHLWDSFGGTINSKGYKVLIPQIRVIYGDSITPNYCKDIYRILIENGFACNNVVLGVGSFSMQCSMEANGLSPFTRDTYGIAVKATYAEVNGKGYQIFKDPKTDSGNFKKSHKGMCDVRVDPISGEIVCTDGYTPETLPKDRLLMEVFKDGKMTKEQSLADIRNLLHANTGGF